MAAVAGMTMPPAERRSPASLSSSTRRRSCSILIGVLSVTDDLADHAEQHDDADDTADDLEDVVGAGLAGGRVDEVRLHGGDLAADDGLGVRAVEELVDGAREPLARLLDLALECAHVATHGHSPGVAVTPAVGRLSIARGSNPNGSSNRFARMRSSSVSRSYVAPSA